MNPIKSLSQFTVVTMNVNGMSQKCKRRKILTHCKHERADIIALCDTRMSEATNKHFLNQTKEYNIHSTLGKNGGRGVSILIHRNFPFQINEIKKDERNRNFLVINGTIYNRKISFAAIYGPNSDDPGFFQYIFDTLQNQNTTHNIILGDFNVTRNHNIDNMNYVTERHPNSRRALNNLIAQQSYHDYIRDISGDQILWTWQKPNSNKRSRLDLILTTSNLYTYIKSASHMEMVGSDHKGVKMVFDFDQFKKGPGLLRISNKTIKDPAFKEKTLKRMVEVFARNHMPANKPRNYNFYIDASEQELNNFRSLSYEQLSKEPMKYNEIRIYEEIMNEVRIAATEHKFEDRNQDSKDLRKIKDKYLY